MPSGERLFTVNLTINYAINFPLHTFESIKVVEIKEQSCKAFTITT